MERRFVIRYRDGSLRIAGLTLSDANAYIDKGWQIFEEVPVSTREVTVQTVKKEIV